VNGDGAATVVASLERTYRLGSCHLVWTAAQARTNYRLAASYHVPLFILHLSWNEPKALPMKLRAPDGTAYTCQYAHNQSRDSTIINKGIVRAASVQGTASWSRYNSSRRRSEGRSSKIPLRFATRGYGATLNETHFSGDFHTSIRVQVKPWLRARGDVLSRGHIETVSDNQ